MITNILILIGTFFGMEAVAWFTHKYVMHGFGWFLHKDHHEPHQNTFEKNDWYFLIFAIPSSLSIMLGMIYKNYGIVFIGFGILLYGLCYVLVHEVFIHQRIKRFTRTNHPYFKAIRYAHKIHHKNNGKHDGKCFGMLFVPMQYYRKALNERKK